jgi:hypothetical protein
LETGVDLTDLVRKFEEAEEAGSDGRDLGYRCRDYFDGKQLTEDQRQVYAKRKQPSIVINRVRRKVDWLRGLEMQSRTDPKAFPRTPKHEQGANAATDALRFVVDETDFDRKRSWVWENLLVEGVGGVEVIHEGEDIRINYYHADRLFYDPHSRLPDFSDARYKGAVVWVDADDLIAQFPGKETEIRASCAHGSEISAHFDDVPRWKQWTDTSRKRVRFVLIYWLDGGVWRWAQYVVGGVLSDGESPYTDEKGASVCPLIMASAYVDREGTRYGVVRDMLDPQDEINMRRSKLLHFLNTRQTSGVKGAVSVAKLKSELAKPDGHVEIDPDAAIGAREAGVPAFQIIPQQDQIAGQFSLLQEAKSEIDLMGANSGLAGKEPGQQSGRAILARQQGGLIEIAPLTDNLSDFTRTVYRHIWMRIRQLWREEKWVRVTDDERNVRFVGLNRPVTLAEQIGALAPEMQGAAIQRLGLVPGDPRLQMPVGMENPVEEIDVDIMLEEVPDAVTLEAETFQAIASVAQAMPGSVPPEVLIEMTPGLKRDVKDRLLKHLEEQKAGQAQQAQAAAPMQEAMAQATVQEKAANVAKTTALAQKTNVEAQRLALGF